MSLLKLPKLPIKPRKSNKRTSKVYRAKEARLELGLEILTNTLDLEDKEVKIYYLSKDILSKAFLFT
jgi:CII-binding regulator of phage lambda lysogenization HflD